MQSKLEFEHKASASTELPVLKTRTLVTTPKITITKQTMLTTPSQQKSQLQQQQQQQTQLQQKQKQLYATLTAKQITTAGNVTTTNSLSKLLLTNKDFKGIIKPLSKPNNSVVSSGKADLGASSDLVATSPNVAIVAAKRPHLTIVPSKALNVLEKTVSDGSAGNAASTLPTANTTTTTATTLKSNVIVYIISNA